MPTGADSNYFDWNRQVEGLVVVRTQMAIAVYWNVNGDICIRQEGQFHPDEDASVVVAPDRVRALANRLLDMVEAERESELVTPTKDRTAAERQRRHRDKRRNGRDSVTATVTDDSLPLAAE